VTPAGDRSAALAAAGARLVEELGDQVEFDAPLASLTTYRVGGGAAVLVRPRDLASLRAVGTVLAEFRGAGTPLSVLVLGKGSNVLVAVSGFPGVVVCTLDLPGDVSVDRARPPVVTAGAGVSLPVLARRTAALGLTGLEWAVGVPGSVGGAVRMNAGGHGSDIAAALLDVDVVDLATGMLTTRPAGDLGLRFRNSDLTDTELVVSARFVLADGDVATSEAEIDEIVRWRRENQPGGRNAGSVFVNPVPGQVAAAQLIDGLGLRGLRIGTAEVSTKHANFIQADDGGTAADVRTVMEEVRRRVHEDTGVLLRSEVRLIGFPDTMEHRGSVRGGQ
jgi:UDP-N-acetylmuramate dehydrogenase